MGDQYRIVERIGQGGMAEVWLAEDTVRQAQVVLKAPLPSKLLEDPGLKDRFVEEVRKMSLDHPHIVGRIPLLQAVARSSGAGDEILCRRQSRHAA